ncbi:MAG TPA: PrsW family glutamic-type intramembrane protease, partial [Candidatus Paceibacterota bacterium]|nr:PrsW family glutamic-type intramembrane protease [Candidatus Paceibacterota bacterium]
MPALSPILFIAFLGGVVPSLLWLAFWLFEDSVHPEPKKYLLLTFVLGMVAVYPVLKIEEFFVAYAAGTTLLLCWAFTEEVGKFVAALLGGILWPVFDEPLDAVIYMVTAALGFAAMENMLFLFGSLQQGVLHGVISGDLRFIGATLLHTLSSATIGVCMAYSYFKPVGTRRLFTVLGVILATALHTLFNFFILGQGGDATFGIFFCI